MQIYPLIELKDKKCVSLHRGRLEEPHIWHVDPIATAQQFGKDGATWLHVTDCDGIDGKNTNRDLLIDMIREVNIPIQLGGGFKSIEGISEWIELGAGRIVVGSLATTSPQTVKQAAHLYPDQIVLAIDVYKGSVMSGGWRTQTAFEPVEFLQNYANDPLAGIIVTDIDAYIEDRDEVLSEMTTLATTATAPVSVRGTIRTLDDISRLKLLPRIEGAVVGRALFNKTIDLKDAINIANENLGLTAEFI